MGIDHMAVEKRRSKSYSQVLDELMAVRKTLVDKAVALDIDQKEEPVPFPWSGSGTVFEGLDGLAWHEEEHTKELIQLAESLADN